MAKSELEKHIDSNLEIIEANINDIGSIVEVLENRVSWLKNKNINQWQNNYTGRYDKNYFMSKISCGDRCYIAKEGNTVVGVVMLERKSKYFENFATDFSGYYIRHFASIKKGVGKALLNFVENLSLNEGKTYIFTNCNRKNEKLVSYYKKGFQKHL